MNHWSVSFNGSNIEDVQLMQSFSEQNTKSNENTLSFVQPVWEDRNFKVW